MARRKKPGSHGYSLLLKDSVIYGAGRALQKFLVALLLPLYTAFLSQADYGILGMVVTVTTFLDVFVTLGFDVAFSRFYFDDKSEAARRRVITNVFYVSTVYPLILLGTVGLLMPQLAPVLLGKEYDAGDWRYFAVALATLFFSNLNDLPFTLFRLEHRPWIFSAYTIGRIFIQVPALHRLRRRVRLGPHGRAARQPLHRRGHAGRACCRRTSARSTGAGTGSSCGRCSRSPSPPCSPASRSTGSSSRTGTSCCTTRARRSSACTPWPTR